MSAQQTRLTAAEWLERRQRPHWSAEDQAALDLWLGKSGNKVAYLRVEAAWKRAERLTALHQPMRSSKQPARSSIWPLLRGAAAGFAFAAIAGLIAWQQMKSPGEETYATAIGGHKAITFADGTRVELNTDTILRISQGNGERKVWLDKGEAYFEVRHDARRPFTVIAQGRKVIDLGTKFVVRQDAAKLHVAVVEGLVEVEAKDEKPQSLLRPGDVLTATAQGQSVIRKPLRAILASLDWKRGKLFLDNATLAEAIAEFNRYNTRKLVIADPRVAKLTVTGTFQTTNPETFTSLTKDIFGVKAENKNGLIILSR